MVEDLQVSAVRKFPKRRKPVEKMTSEKGKNEEGRNAEWSTALMATLFDLQSQASGAATCL